jgi:hypothetical protein
MNHRGEDKQESKVKVHNHSKNPREEISSTNKRIPAEDWPT